MYVPIKVKTPQLKNSLYYPDEDEVALNEQAGGFFGITNYIHELFKDIKVAV